MIVEPVPRSVRSTPRAVSLLVVLCSWLAGASAASPGPDPSLDLPTALTRLRGLVLRLSRTGGSADIHAGGWSAPAPELPSHGPAQDPGAWLDAIGHEMLLLDHAVDLALGELLDPRACAPGPTWDVRGPEQALGPGAPASAPLLGHVLENTGNTALIAPRLVGSDGRDWSTVDGLLEHALGDAVGDRERALALWRWVVRHRVHGDPPTDGSQLHDAVLMANVYGVGFCDDSAHVLADLAAAAGMRSRVWALTGHVVPEIEVDGAWALLDPDNECWYPVPETGAIAGCELLAARPELLATPVLAEGREAPLYPVELVTPFYTSTQDNRIARDAQPDGRVAMHAVLAPGDRLALYAASLGRRLANSYYRPSMAPGASGLWQATRRLGTSGPLVLESPYPLVAARARADLSATGPLPAVEARCGAGRWQAVDWLATGDGRALLPLTDVLPLARDEPSGRLELRVAEGAGDVALDCELVLSVAAVALPVLTAGERALTYRATSDGPARVSLLTGSRPARLVDPVKRRYAAGPLGVSGRAERLVHMLEWCLEDLRAGLEARGLGVAVSVRPARGEAEWALDLRQELSRQVAVLGQLVEALEAGGG